MSAPPPKTKGKTSSGAPLKATMDLDATRRKAPISRRLFGKFTEHLGANVYQGAWAQIVVNPEFAPANRWARLDALQRRLGRHAKAAKMPGLTGVDLTRFAPFWLPVGDVAGRLLRRGRRDVQRVSVKTGDGELASGVFLPLRRVRTYELTLKARTASAGKKRGVVTVAILTPDGKTVAEAKVWLTDEWKQAKASLAVPAGVKARPGEPFWLSLRLKAGTVAEFSRILLLPSDHLCGWDPEIVAYMKRAHLPLLRFPGGNFASTYHWRDGVGPVDDRPVLANRAWPDVIECNHVGTDEWLKLCELVGAEPMICVNAGSGTPDEARDWIAYCNAPPDAPLGRLRAANGHRAAYNVRVWELGNELYGRWQAGHTDAKGYAERCADFHDAMRPGPGDLLLIANGFDEAWNDVLVRRAGARVRSISAHFLVGGGLPGDLDPTQVFRQFMAFSATFERELQKLYRPMAKAGLEPSLAVTELQIFTDQPTIPNNQTLAEALWVADLTNACLRDGHVELITHTGLVNHGGGLRKERGIVYANPVWWTTHLYGTQDGVIPTGVRVQSPAFSVPDRWVAKATRAPCLGAAALLSASGRAWTVFVVNRHPSRAIQADIRLKGFDAAPSAKVVTLTGESFMAVNTPESPKRVHPKSSTIRLRAGQARCTFPPASLTRISLSRRQPPG